MVKKFLHHNPDLVELPRFFYTETNLQRFKIIVCVLCLVLVIGSICFLAWAMQTKQTYFRGGYFAIPGIIGTIVLIILVFQGIQFHFWKKEVRELSQHFDQQSATAGVTSIYQKLVVSFSNINWLASYLYLTALFTLLISDIVFYFMEVNDVVNLALSGHQEQVTRPLFGSLTYGTSGNRSYYAPTVVLCSVVIFIGIVFLNQVAWQVLNLIRLKRIETTYHQPIMTMEAKAQLRANVNKRNFIIFLALTVVFGLIAFLVYRLFRRKK